MVGFDEFLSRNSEKPYLAALLRNLGNFGAALHGGARELKNLFEGFAESRTSQDFQVSRPFSSVGKGHADP